MMTPSEVDPIWGATGCRKRETTDVMGTALAFQRFSDIVISVNRWLSVEGRRCLILASTESSCDSRTPSWERSSKRCTVTIWSRAADLRFRSGSETSWWPMRARSSKSRSRARHYVTSPAAPRTGNDGVSRGPSVGPREGDANEPKPRNRADAAQISSASTKGVIFRLALLRLTFRRLPSVASGRQHQDEGNVFNRAGSLAEPCSGLENGVHPRESGWQTVTHVPGLFRYRCRRPHRGAGSRI
jgi:hypothetical protein